MSKDREFTFFKAVDLTAARLTETLLVGSVNGCPSVLSLWCKLFLCVLLENSKNEGSYILRTKKHINSYDPHC